ncbi:MAG: DUF262 domain-containing protein [Lactobacillales bacterium]|jgi:hypothetical protein|nr:DUF262 domain-containing protein [Lactobacillales bacterium]
MSTRYNLKQLLIDFKVEIPAIQRDFAFGRKEAKQKRESFVENLLKGLLDDKGLHLDFVYGQEADGIMVMLDGQQRITTLWLIAVYMDRTGLGHADTSFSNILSRFSYDTRTSSKEFCNALLVESWDERLLDRDLSVKYQDVFFEQKWFFNSWRFDPTITGMVAMLHTIHEIFRHEQNEYSKIEISHLNRITFSFLPIEDLGQSEELYLKMNARGKALNDWDNYKAKLFENADSKQFKKEVDGELLDYFWKINKDNEPQVNTEKSLYKLFNTIKRLGDIIGDEGDNRASAQKFWRFLIKNDEIIRSIDFERFSEQGLRLPDLLSSLADSNRQDITWNDLTLFAAYFLFAEANDPVGLNDVKIDELKQIIRIAQNLIDRNHRPDEDSNTKNIVKLKAIIDEGLGALPEEDKISHRLLGDVAWESLIYKAEKHPLSAGTAKWLIDASVAEFSKAEKILNKTLYSENSIFTVDGIRDVTMTAKLWSYDAGVRNGIKIANGAAAHSEKYSWWSYLHLDSAGTAIRDLIDGGFEYNVVENLIDDFHNYREWFMAAPEILNEYQSFKETWWGAHRDYILKGQKTYINGSKWQLQLVVLERVIKEITPLDVAYHNGQGEDFVATFADKRYQVRYEDEHFKISDDAGIIFVDSGDSVSEKLSKTRDEIIKLTND